MSGITGNHLIAWLLSLGGIVLVDISLSGDNALVIGAVASRLPPRQRVLALVWGGLAAIVFRVALTAVAAELLLIPLVQTVGAAIILIIAIRMLLPHAGDARAIKSSERFIVALTSILVADATMSLDNILAIGALARGDVPLLGIGLLISMLILLAASAVVARLIERFAWLEDLTALLLAYVAAQLALGDPLVARALRLTAAGALLVTLGALALVLLVDIVVRMRRTRAPRTTTPQPELRPGGNPPLETGADADSLPIKR